MTISIWITSHPGRPSRLRWNRKCRFCGIRILTGERHGWCCANGKYRDSLPSLPPLPVEYQIFSNDARISSLSRRLNLTVSFAALETTHAFPNISGGPSFVAVEGKVYHRIRPQHTNSAIRWLLFDGDPPFQEQTNTLPAIWTIALQSALRRINPLVTSLLDLRLLPPHVCHTAKLVLRESTATGEIAAIMNFTNTTSDEVDNRSLISIHLDGRFSRIPCTSRNWEPLCYPLLFPHGTLGWGVTSTSFTIDNLVPDDIADEGPLQSAQIMYYRLRILSDDRFGIFGRLTNEYLVDMFSRNLEMRLNYIRSNQERLRHQDAELMGLPYVPDKENIYLPASFLGSWRHSREQIADSLAIAAQYGGPTFFITFTCNARWPEILSELRPGQNHTDVPLVVVRVFRRKLASLLDDLNSMFPNAGRPLYVIYSIEFQKRGLPHAHILIKYLQECIQPAHIDAVISAELPSNAVDADLVQMFMLHKHPNDMPAPYCRRSNQSAGSDCRFHYPQHLREHTSLDQHGRVLYRRRHPHDRWVVPYNLTLLRRYSAHINFEAANGSHLFQYLFKYIQKGPDFASYALRDGGSSDIPIDEIEEYWNGRYLSAGEAAWRICGFHMSHKRPSVSALSIHLPGSSSYQQYTRRDGNESSMSTLQHYFHRPVGMFIHPRTHVATSFDSLTYLQYFQLFRLSKYDHAQVNKPNTFVEVISSINPNPRLVLLRVASHEHIVRLHDIHVKRGEEFYLRTLLLHRTGRSADDFKMVNGQMHATFQEAATALQLFADITEAQSALAEAIQSLRTPRQLRLLFVDLLINDCVILPLDVWHEFKDDLSLDFYLDLFDNDQAYYHALQDIASRLEEHGKTLADFSLPAPDVPSHEVSHELFRWAPHRANMELEWRTWLCKFNAEQSSLWQTVVSAIQESCPLFLFVDGQAGRGKTTVLQQICNYCRSQRHIILVAAASAFAAQQYAGGRTIHSLFKIPVNDGNEFLSSSITRDSGRADLIRRSKVIILDELPMLNRAALSCAEETVRDLVGTGKVWGDKIIITAGDFRQTCPVVRGGSKARVIDASVRSSPLWSHFQVQTLCNAWRNGSDEVFCRWVDAIGDGAGPDIDVSCFEAVHSDAEMIDFVFPIDTLTDPLKTAQCAILAPTNAQIDLYNDKLLDLIPGDSRLYHATDEVKEAVDNNVTSPTSTLAYAAHTRLPGLPVFRLKVKIGGMYRLLRNFSVDRGLVKNVRVVVTSLGQRLVSVRLVKDGMQHMEDILIPRITFHHQLPSGHTLLRRQYPLAPAYATTFNGCQGLTLTRVGLDLQQPVFSHGQLYTAFSRVRKRENLCVRLMDGENTTINITYPEILL